MENRFTESIKNLYDGLTDLRQRALDAERAYTDDLEAVPMEGRDSARNLVHYLGVRKHDIRPLQVGLSFLGLSSLGRLEAHALAALDSVLFALERMTDATMGPDLTRPMASNFKEGDQALIRNTKALLGPPGSERLVRIMATMPSEAAEDYPLVRDLMTAGMDVMRINSAHDDEDAWQKMVQHARRAERELNRTCRILFDLGGPKLRTGALEPEPAVVHFRPRRDERGLVVDPARVWVGSAPAPATERPISAAIPVGETLAAARQPADRLQFHDLPGRLRTLRVTETAPGGAWAEARQACYLEPSLPLQLIRDGQVVASGQVGPLPPRESSLWLTAGDILMLTPEGQLGRSVQRAPDGSIQTHAQIPCTLPEAFEAVRIGDPILFDDGKFWGTVHEASRQGLTIQIDRTPPVGARLRADKGINLPRTKLTLPALSPQDLRSLDFAARHVDMVGLSFVREPADLYQLQTELTQRDRSDMGIILKIENQAAFENLPQLLLAGLREPPFGVMVARGDLGVELGFERLAEVQEQILWLCEAAHVPVIWATQVLESLAKKGMPSRAEVTDAAMSGRAECVMLNKGPFIHETVRFLDQVLMRMRDHHHKKTPMLRRLKVSEGRFRGQDV